MEEWATIQALFGQDKYGNPRLIEKATVSTTHSAIAAAKDTQLIRVPDGRNFVITKIRHKSTNLTGKGGLKVNNKDCQDSLVDLVWWGTPYVATLPERKESFIIEAVGGANIEVTIENNHGGADTFYVWLEGVYVYPTDAEKNAREGDGSLKTVVSEESEG